MAPVISPADPDMVPAVLLANPDMAPVVSPANPNMAPAVSLVNPDMAPVVSLADPNMLPARSLAAANMGHSTFTGSSQNGHMKRSSFYFGLQAESIMSCCEGVSANIGSPDMLQSTMQGGVPEGEYCSSKTDNNKFEEMVHISRLIMCLLL